MLVSGNATLHTYKYEYLIIMRNLFLAFFSVVRSTTWTCLPFSSKSIPPWDLVASVPIYWPTSAWLE